MRWSEGSGAAMLPTRSLLGYGICLSLLALSLLGCGRSPNEDIATPPQTFLAWLMNVIRPAPPGTVAKLDALAQQFQRQGQFALAEQHYRQALSIREHAWGLEHPQVAPGLDQLADLYMAQGKHADVEALLQRALAIREQKLGREHQDVAATLEKYAALLRQMHRDADAQPLETRAQAIRTRPAAAQRASTP